VNRGWLVARATLGNERISLGDGSSAPTGFTPEITRNTIDERIVGLPRDPLLK
jgi:hypothetical protein